MAAPTLAGGSSARNSSAQNTSAERPIRPKKRELPFPLNLYQTAVGKKWVMAVTGLMLLGFVVFHMLGNLKLYLGAVEHNGEAVWDIDLYGEFLRELLVPLFPRTYFLWLLRFGLMGAFALHIHSAYSLTRMNQTSGSRYQSKQDWLAANFASRSMRVTGIITILYLVFHLADLTWGISAISPDWERGEVYNNLAYSLGRWWVALIYIAANVAISIHIFHGAWSMFQSLGLNNPRWNSLRRSVAAGLAGAILIGNLSFPVAIIAGAIEPGEPEVSLESNE